MNTTPRNLYLIKRCERPAYHKAPYHRVIICDRKYVALWQAGDTGALAWVWSSPNDPQYGWQIERWQGLDIDYGHVIHHVPLPDGTSTGFWHWNNIDHPHIAMFRSLFEGAVWWSDRKIPKWLEERGVIYPPDQFTRQRILDDIANDGVSGFRGSRKEPSFWPPAVPEDQAGYLP